MSEVMALHDLGSMATTIDYAVEQLLDQEMMSNVDLARLLYQRLQSEEEQ